MDSADYVEIDGPGRETLKISGKKSGLQAIFYNMLFFIS
jgi:hypothetical protein